MSTVSIISDKYGNMKKISNAQDGINLTSIQNIKKISDRPNNINSALGIADNKSKILSVPYQVKSEKPIVEKQEKIIKSEKPIVELKKF